VALLRHWLDILDGEYDRAMTPIFLRPSVRPYLILVGVVVLLAAIDAGNSGFLCLVVHEFPSLEAVEAWVEDIIGQSRAAPHPC
jgi:hypothetical protein